MSQRAAVGRPRLKRERASTSQSGRNASGNDAMEDIKMPNECDRRVLRSHYRRLKSSIAEEKGDLVRGDAQKFDAMVERVESLHLLVYRPREQIADAEALFDITEAFLSSVKEARRGGGISSADLVSAILQRFGQVRSREEPAQIDWGAVGLEALAVLNDAPGICTMLGPMESSPKTRKASGPRRRRATTTEMARPETVGDESAERTETDKNIRTMFNILRKCGPQGCQLEPLVLNRTSFAETVENIFFLSFLVKDGRAQISIKDGKHIVVFRYAPSAEERSGRRCENGREEPVLNTQFVFRYDFNCWLVMKETVESGKELMPKRSEPRTSMTPIRKNSRNRGREITELNQNSAFSLGDTGNEDDIEMHTRKRSIF